MSGGHFEYRDVSLCDEIFGYQLSPHYGIGEKGQSRLAAKLNPLEDRQISEIVFDMLCLLSSYDYYRSGDTGEETYRDDVQRFKEKWLSPNRKQIDERTVNEMIEDLREEIYKTIGIEKPLENSPTDC